MYMYVYIGLVGMYLVLCVYMYMYIYIYSTISFLVWWFLVIRLFKPSSSLDVCKLDTQYFEISAFGKNKTK